MVVDTHAGAAVSIEERSRICVVCLAHSEGACGEEIGQQLATRLGFRYADDAIVVAAAETEHVFPEAVSLAESEAPDAGSRSTSTASRRPSMSAS